MTPRSLTKAPQLTVAGRRSTPGAKRDLMTAPFAGMTEERIALFEGVGAPLRDLRVDIVQASELLHPRPESGSSPGTLGWRWRCNRFRRWRRGRAGFAGVRADAPVDDDMADMDAPRPQLARHALAKARRPTCRWRRRRNGRRAAPRWRPSRIVPAAGRVVAPAAAGPPGSHRQQVHQLGSISAGVARPRACG